MHVHVGSILVERAESFHAVEFFGFPIRGEFQHGQAIGTVWSKLGRSFERLLHISDNFFQPSVEALVDLLKAAD